MPKPNTIKINKQELEQMYFDQKMTQRQIAHILGVDQSSVSTAFKRMGIMSRSQTEALNNRYDGIRKDTVVYRQLIKKEKCIKCGTTENLLIHHKDLDHFNNSLSNLEVMCLSCHMRLHKTLNHKGIKSNAPAHWR